MEILVVNGLKDVEASKGHKITFPSATKVTPADKLYKIVDVSNA